MLVATGTVDDEGEEEDDANEVSILLHGRQPGGRGDTRPSLSIGNKYGSVINVTPNQLA